jgi:hypothetical protein
MIVIRSFRTEGGRRHVPVQQVEESMSMITLSRPMSWATRGEAFRGRPMEVRRGIQSGRDRFRSGLKDARSPAAMTQTDVRNIRSRLQPEQVWGSIRIPWCLWIVFANGRCYIQRVRVSVASIHAERDIVNPWLVILGVSLHCCGDVTIRASGYKRKLEMPFLSLAMWTSTDASTINDALLER